MKFYTVSDKFVSYLKAIDSRVQDNYHAKKTYLGILIVVDGRKYIAPLTSYKPKQDRISSDSPLSFKLQERTDSNNKLGMIQLNNMIPVLDSEISLLDMQAQTPKFRRMLYKQYEYIKTKKTDIQDRALKLYGLRTKPEAQDFFKKMCCDFEALEKCLSGYTP